jgi:uncharacterized protein
VRFDWDDEKNKQNVSRHGFDFSDAWEIFELPMLVGVDTRGGYGEQRLIGIGFLNERVVVVVFTESEDDTIRIISLRKALKHEREKFGHYLKHELGAH